MSKTYTLTPRVEFEALESGDYIGTLVEYREVVQEKDSGFRKKGDIQVEFKWEVQVPGEEPVERRSWATPPRTYSKKSGFVHIIEALGLTDPNVAAEAGAQVDLDAGLGKRALLTIVRFPKDDDTWGDRIEAYGKVTGKLPRKYVAQPAMTAEDVAARRAEEALGDIPF